MKLSDKCSIIFAQAFFALMMNQHIHEATVQSLWCRTEKTKASLKMNMCNYVN